MQPMAHQTRQLTLWKGFGVSQAWPAVCLWTALAAARPGGTRKNLTQKAKWVGRLMGILIIA